jgi:sterol desaturase/sphingolipid hydroxylase (fatty acid hydroxylase superfamily)
MMETGLRAIPAQKDLARSLIRWGLYPLLWAMMLGSFHLIWKSGIEPSRIWAINSTVTVILCLFVEWRFPYERRWSMTWRTLWADIKFAVINSAAIGALSFALGYFAIQASGDLHGPAHDWPPALQLVTCLLIFEAINYSIHRAMHEMGGATGDWLWKIHAAHHLPPRLYLVMHAVFHPFNGLIIRGLVIVLPVWLMGYRQEIVTMFMMINGLHGLISHFNVDMRMGWANYLFVGPELHRYHHSAKPEEGKNYGATLSIFDQIFGTFVYRPGTPPQDLGVMHELGLPDYEDTGAVLAMPFR